MSGCNAAEALWWHCLQVDHKSKPDVKYVSQSVFHPTELWFNTLHINYKVSPHMEETSILLLSCFRQRLNRGTLCFTHEGRLENCCRSELSREIQVALSSLLSQRPATNPQPRPLSMYASKVCGPRRCRGGLTNRNDKKLYQQASVNE